MKRERGNKTAASKVRREEMQATAPALRAALLWHGSLLAAPISAVWAYPLHKEAEMLNDQLTAKSIKATLVLNPAEVTSISVPEGKPRCLICIAVAGRTVTADLNAKSVRRAIANIREAGQDNVSCILQGRLDANNALLDAGLAIQVKTKIEAATKET